MDYRKVSKMKMIANTTTNVKRQERMPRSNGRNKYKPANAQINPAPHTESPQTTNAIFTTNFMLIGRLLLSCFLFFSTFLIISDFFFMPYCIGVLPYVSDTSKGRRIRLRQIFGKQILPEAKRRCGDFFPKNLTKGFAEIPLYPKHKVVY
jgi:hypothetical protein